MGSEAGAIPDDDKCATCSQTFAWHREHNPIHPFNTGQAGAAAFIGTRRDPDDQDGKKTSQRGFQAPSRVAMPMDPVLRQALIDAGVLTPDDLKRAEEKIMAITGMFNQSLPAYRGSDHGESAESSRRG